jgi:membrane protease YdiL (CAAX protease family)
MNEQKSNKINIALYILVFNILWLVRVLLIPKTQSDEINFLITIILKFLIFVLFPYLYIKFCYKENPLEVFKLNTSIGKGVLFGIIVSSIVVFLAIIVYVFSKGNIHLIGLNAKDLFVAFIFAGFMEEVTFRGMILGNLVQFMDFKKANILTSLLFTFIHMPQSIASGTVFTQAVLSSLVFIFVWGIIDGVLVKKSNSLWAAIIPHGIWDCAVHILGY